MIQSSQAEATKFFPGLSGKEILILFLSGLETKMVWLARDNEQKISQGRGSS